MDFISICWYRIPAGRHVHVYLNHFTSGIEPKHYYYIQMRTRLQATKIGRRKYVRETMNEVLMPADKAAENYEGQEDLSSEFGQKFYKHGFRRRVRGPGGGNMLILVYNKSSRESQNTVYNLCHKDDNRYVNCAKPLPTFS